MGLDRDELLLYSLNKILSSGDERFSPTRKQVADSIGVSEATLNVYLSRLSSRGYIERKRSRYRKGIRENITLTDEGESESARISGEIERMVLTPEKHGINTIIELKTILERMKNPLEGINFVSTYTKYPSFDLPLYLDSTRLSRLETSPVDFLENIEKSGDSGSMDSIFRSCFFGDLDTVLRRLDGSQPHNIEGVLIYAEAAHRQGRFDEARMIYDMIINQRERFTLNHWIVANIGLSQILRKEGRYDEAIELLDSVAHQLDDRVLTAFVKERKALVYVVCHRMEEALDTYRSCIATFRSRGLNHFLHASYNNRGTLFFRLERYDEAESDWIKGRRCAIKAKSKYGEAAALVNLSDILSMRDETDLAFKYLDRAAKVYSKLNDYEGMSGVEFNLALVHLALGNVERSAHHFERSMTIAKPFPSPMMRKDRTDFYLKRAEELGLKSVKNLI